MINKHILSNLSLHKNNICEVYIGFIYAAINQTCCNSYIALMKVKIKKKPKQTSKTNKADVPQESYGFVKIALKLMLLTHAFLSLSQTTVRVNNISNSFLSLSLKLSCALRDSPDENSTSGSPLASSLFKILESQRFQRS